MNEDTYWHRVNQISRYGALLAQGGFITKMEAIDFTYHFLVRLLSIKLMEQLRKEKQCRMR